MEFPKLDKQSLINAFLSENEQPSKDIMRKNLSVLKNILVVAKRK